MASSKPFALTAVQQFAEIAIGVAIIVTVFRVGDFLNGRAAIGLDVDNGHELNVRLREKATQVVGTTVSDTDSRVSVVLLERHEECLFIKQPESIIRCTNRGKD